MNDSELIPQQTPESTGGPQSGDCPSCGNAQNLDGTANFVYALGRIQARFPSMSVEKEFAQAAGRAETAGLTNNEVIQSVLAQKQNRYLVRQLCWVFTVEGLDTYLLRPRDPADLDLFVEALRSSPRPTDVDVIIGVRGPIAPPQLCNGLMVPIVTVDHLYSFDIDSLLKSIPRPQTIAEDRFSSTAEELLWRVMQMADNAGASDEHRALNYLAIRYSAIYAHTAEAFGRNFALTSVDVRPSRLSGIRKIVDVIFSFTNRQNDVLEKSFVRVDVTDEFPFLMTKLSPYYDLN